VPARRIVFGIDEPIYLSVHTPAARLVDGPGEVAHLLWYGDTADDQRPRLEALLDRAQPGWRDEVVDLRAGRRLVVAHGRPLPGRGFAGRPPAMVPDVPGLFVAGDWVGPEGLLADAVLGSARAAGRLAASTVAPALRLSA
jgi:phytoene dehydrogenase-like protein